MSKMRAAQYYGRRDVRVEDVPIPEPGPGECLVEVEWCGICGSDLHEYVAGPVGIPTPERPHPLTGGQTPLTLGHEFCGRIKTIPPGSSSSSKWKVGQAVMVDPHVVCRSCLSCRSGNDQMCSTLAFVGISDSRRGGGLSEYVVVEEDHIHALPDNVGLEYAAVIEPLAVGHHAAKMANTDLRGLDVLIVGGGPVGVGMISVLRAHGVGTLLLSEPTAARWAHAKATVDRVIDPKTENVGDVCRSLTDGGKGVDVVFDCAGVQPGLDAGMDALRHGGTLVNVAIWEQSPAIPFWRFFLKELKFVSSACYNMADFKEVMELIGKGQFQGYEKMVTSRVALEDVVEKGFEELVNNRDDQIKILISPKLRSSQA
ncbi:hypothetical protein LTR99_006030 [Exophiala xenobiotica]|uniref:Enoyl reductase (ER) domain-containing protein n=1 Tax=Vermiconidia calcicola TaxID=1690605 RepID=A0AAV9QFL5_9PEZI|nr:hypothetical protein LTR92_006081 [Exophiala xenobiotica]KAK5540898.1 hypothetical protein LTR25_002675 [Vermiconidia calcicola]KAK5549611.1 hypothetical protein LTR23_000719 [Chaetothyriales sp. CCFEE 6169]KAK5267011.1 hypothetical protein LTR96_007678 [Exophiala xenobiotica]KAK5303073.1 hypothetical protein LTR99_006030 [Exophiala xenobiotica]